MKAHKIYYLFMSTFLIVSSLLVSSCGKKVYEDSSTTGINRIEIPDPIPGKIKAIRLGQAEEFSILAYASISSIPSSSIAAKVGLMPGMRELITVDPSEVAGGAADIFGSDDDSIPINLLSNAKVDMVTAYMSAVNIVADKDKIGIHNGVIDEKILTPGVYEWSNGVTISKDFTLQGSDSDIWIFKIHGYLRVENGVRMILSNGAKPENIMWQVAGSVVFEPESNFSGTVIAQPSIEMKKNSVLTGRAFCKNGFVSLHQAKIKKP